MLSAILVCTACLAFDQPAPKSTESLEATNLAVSYEQAKRQVGRNPDDHVRLALWCEAHRMESERQNHLTIALLKDPGHATARGLMGLVNFRDRWRSPEAVSDQLKADASDAAIRAEYIARRARMGRSGEDHWKIALWCEQHGLKPEATAHLAAVTQLDPDRDAAWKRLGYKRQSGRWVTDGQVAAEKAEAEAKRRAVKHWLTRMTRWRDELEDITSQAEATQSLQSVTDPRAVRAVLAVFGTGKASLQKIAVQVLGQIDSTPSTCALVLLAVSGDSGEVRSNATQTLRRRDPRGAASFLVALLRDPVLDPDPIVTSPRWW